MKVVIFNVKFSANMGDGVIAECLEAELRRRTGWDVCSIDLAGRKAWTVPTDGQLRTLALSIVHHTPERLRTAAVEALLGFHVYRKLLPRWRSLLVDVDAAIIGGGQLFQDGDLNFPIKIGAAYAACRERKIDVGIYAVGVAPIKSRRGQELFSPLLSSPRLVHASVRDEQSRVAMLERGCNASVCPDPGLLAAKLWPIEAPTARARPLIGVGIAHPVVLSHHGGRGAVESAGETLTAFRQLIRCLAMAGCDVVCFTNGAAEDEEFKAKVAATFGQNDLLREYVQFAQRRATPGDLARLIGSFDGVVAHRLHAVIVGYAYGKPVIGLRWDKKLDAFLESIDQSASLVKLDRTCGPVVRDRMLGLLDRGLDRGQHARAIQEAEDGIGRLVAALGRRAEVTARWVA